MMSQLQLSLLITFSQVIVFVSLLTKLRKKHCSGNFYSHVLPHFISSKQYTILNNDVKKKISFKIREFLSFSFGVCLFICSF